MTGTPSAPPSETPAPAKKKHTLAQTVRALGNPRVAGMAALGFSSGMPFMLTGGTLGYWLAEAGASLAAIGFLSWVGLAYTFKVFWAPMVDRVKLPGLSALGQRRSWSVLVQIIIAISLLAMAVAGPNGPGGLATIGAFALVVAFASATQDIAIDAWRIEESRDADELGTFTSAYQLGYRVALLVTDALILVFANRIGWPLSYSLMAVLMGVGLFAALRMPEPERREAPEAGKQAQTSPARVATGRSTQAAGFLLLAAAIYGVIPLLPKWDWLAILGLLGDHSQFGTGFATVCLALAACAYLRVPNTWIAGAIAIGVVVLVAFYGAVTGNDPIGKAPMFWPTVLCLVGAAMAAPPRVFDAFLGPLIAFFQHHGRFAAVMLLMISLYRLPEFVIGPVAGPFYTHLGLSKEVVGAVRASVGMFAAFGGIAVGGVCVAALGFRVTLLIGAVLQGLGVAAYALLAYFGNDIGLFSFAMAADNFCYAFAGVALIAYMSSLTSIGYTATQYALLSSVYTIFGKVLKGLSGVTVEGLQAAGNSKTDAFGLFYIGAGLVAAPAFLLCLVILARKETPSAAPAPA